MKLYGIASTQSKDVDEFFVTRDEAERVLEQVLQDEPDFASVLYVAEIDCTRIVSVVLTLTRTSSRLSRRGGSRARTR